jgi:Fur family ferric uptake transcriptional regulator
MDDTALTELMSRHDIRPTANRILILRMLQRESRPLSLGELEDRLPLIDKSNISRTLTAFRSRHLVHVLESGDEVMRYELCLSHSEDADDDMHVHFYCEQCHRTFCLSDLAIPTVEIPAGYQARTATYLVKGLCPECRKSAH